MKKLVVVVVAVLLVSAFAVLDASAAGIGFYLEGGSGSGEMTVEDWWTGNDYDTDIDMSHGGIGFMLDTAPSGSSVFNYRFNVGFESTTLSPDIGEDADVTGIVMMHDFGFAIVKTSKVRFWAGPEVKLGYYTGETETNEDDLKIALFGIGPVAGVNIGLSSSVSLAFKLGIIYEAFGGEGESSFSGNMYDISGHATVAIINAGLLF